MFSDAIVRTFGLGLVRYRSSFISNTFVEKSNGWSLEK